MSLESALLDSIIRCYQKLKEKLLDIHSSSSAYFYVVCKNRWRNRLCRKNKLILDEEAITTFEETEITLFKDIENEDRECLYRTFF